MKIKWLGILILLGSLSGCLVAPAPPPAYVVRPYPYYNYYPGLLIITTLELPMFTPCPGRGGDTTAATGTTDKSLTISAQSQKMANARRGCRLTLSSAPAVTWARARRPAQGRGAGFLLMLLPLPARREDHATPYRRLD